MTQYMESHKSHVPVTTNQKMVVGEVYPATRWHPRDTLFGIFCTFFVILQWFYGYIKGNIQSSKLTVRPWQIEARRFVSTKDGLFSGSMSIFQRVISKKAEVVTTNNVLVNLLSWCWTHNGEPRHFTAGSSPQLRKASAKGGGPQGNHHSMCRHNRKGS